MSELIALLNEREVGTVRQDHGRLSFEYADSWRNAADSYPLSMPLRPRGMNMRRSRSFYGGCCPTTSSSLASWGRRFHVSPRNPFALLAHVGEDCAGAVQFVGRERLDAFLTARPGEVEWRTWQTVARAASGCQRMADGGGYRSVQSGGCPAEDRAGV